MIDKWTGRQSGKQMQRGRKNINKKEKDRGGWVRTERKTSLGRLSMTLGAPQYGTSRPPLLLEAL